MPHPIPNEILDAGDIAIIGRKGTGKTYAAKGLAERLIRRGRRVVVIDPLGIWWGLKVDATGTKPGLPIVVIGGPQADIPLADASEASAVQVARFLLTSDVSVIIDVADMKRPANLSFMAALLRELYENNTGEPTWLILEEADIWAPQHARTREERAVFAEIEILARRGRSRGFRLVSITQRPARLHKDVLTQFDTMAVLALPGRHDRLAIRHWLEGVVPDHTEVYNTLPTLPVGEAWIWTPQDKRLVRDRFPLIETYDTSHTPKPGDAKPTYTALSESELSALRQSFSALNAPLPTGSGLRIRPAHATVAGAAISRLRGELRMTQAQLAELIGSDQKSVSRMESGRTYVSTRILERMAEKTGSILRIAFVPKPKQTRTENSEPT